MLNDFLGTLSKLLSLRPTKPAPVIPVFTLILGAQQRPGLSAARMYADFLARKQELGLPTGDYADGTPNYEEMLFMAMFEVLTKGIQEDLRVTVAVPANIPLQAQGMSPAGPVTVVGATLTPLNAYGIAQ